MTYQVNPSTFIQSHPQQLPEFFPEALRASWLKEAAGHFAAPLVWLCHPTTGMTHCWEVDDDEAALIRRVLNVGARTLKKRDLAHLRDRGVIYDSEEHTCAAAEFGKRMEAARTSLRQHGYAVLRDLMLPGYSGQFRRYQDRIADQIKLGDRQVANRKRKHNDAFCRVLHFDLCRIVAGICEESIQPSYCYLAIYLPGSTLPRHTDRPQCRWNASMLLDSEPLATKETGWPIFVECPDDSVRSATAGLGDIVIYNGIATPHWREEMPAAFDYQSICFFHFVALDFSGTLS